jgi:hypothetical protein
MLEAELWYVSILRGRDASTARRYLSSDHIQLLSHVMRFLRWTFPKVVMFYIISFPHPTLFSFSHGTCEFLAYIVTCKEVEVET